LVRPTNHNAGIVGDFTRIIIILNKKEEEEEEIHIVFQIVLVI
jgi:hypothetical protein